MTVTHPERGVDRHCDLGASRKLHRGLLTNRSPLQTARKGRSHDNCTSCFISARSSADASRRREQDQYYDDGLSAFLSVRPRLFGIAYRMLGSAAEAEDIVQDVWVRWQTADRSLVRDAAAFLATTTTRLAINVMQSARSRRETYVGPWLPEPVDTSADPAVGSGTRRGAGVWGPGCCWRSCRPPNEPPTSFERRSTIHTATSRTSFGLKRPTRGKW